VATASDVAVVVPSWNCLDDLRACVSSVHGDARDEPELLVVDNGSGDGTRAWLEQAGVEHVALRHNTGFAAAVNLGAARTRAPFIFVLNADAVVEPGCVERLARALAASGLRGGVQPRLLALEPDPERQADDPGARIYSLGQFLTRDGRAYEAGAGEPQGASQREQREVFGVCGAACMLRRELFTELGGYDERYFAFYEDVDLNVRARIAGWSFSLEPAAVVWHRGGGAWEAGFQRPRADNARLVARNRLATQIKFVPAGSIPRIAAAEAGSLARAAAQRRGRATAAGKLAALRQLRPLLAQRRELRRRGELERAQRWLGASAGRAAG
jgi:GT2 family glycosyltransferase